MSITPFSILQKRQHYSAFTLIELLVVISIIAIIMAVSIFGLSNARQSARDGRRKSDIETIRTAIELYRADCGNYPANISSPLRGANASGNTCLNSYTYLQAVPTDPGTASYIYRRITNTTYEICATQEQPGSGSTCGTGGTCTCNGSTTCGGGTCRYRVTNP